MEFSMINGIIVSPLEQIVDERGKVMHMLRSDSPLFINFGEIYFSLINPGAVKAWKRHLKMTQHFAVPIGKIKLVFFDQRPNSPTSGAIDIMEIGGDNYCLVKVPPMIWYGFSGIASIPSLIANCTDMAHDPAETERADINAPFIPYKWKQPK
ncbi:MAG: dTDP-4-dehydrorhamnose 3,5-epimerase [Elusimicrobia bacterium RIFOXYB2_FULL_50_12]|nr:MAG: dTDP-4-dehydrorhamnose 3,5-epimerase [Elusimicrobia bacterium RIFOXYB2_FULL_50_12]